MKNRGSHWQLSLVAAGVLFGCEAWVGEAASDRTANGVELGDAGLPNPGDGGGGAGPDGGLADPDGGQANPDGGGPNPDGGSGNPDGGGPAPDGGIGTCAVQTALAGLGKSRLLVGASMADATAALAPFDVRYLYLAGGLFDGTDACASCATGCSAAGVSCVNGGCIWWGCWQWDQIPPGDYVRNFISKAKARSQIPMITYYELFQASGATEGNGEILAAANVGLMTRYFADWRFLLKTVGQERAILHIEPDFWGYAQRFNANAHLVPVAVATANPTDCTGYENSVAGMGRCMIAMARSYAPNARVGLHASGWAVDPEAPFNSNPAVNVVPLAQSVAAFLKECGAAEGDFIVIEASDRDAGYYQSIGKNRWWDDQNLTLPHFHQAFAWAKALSEALGKPNFWWQLPVGNMSLSNTTGHWRDNRVDYYFAHPSEVVAAQGMGMVFGAGASGQTNPENDNGNLVNRVTAYALSGGQAPCP